MPQLHMKDPGKKAHCAHGGPMHCDMGCYAEGGRVDSGKNRSDFEKGVHKPKEGLMHPYSHHFSGLGLSSAGTKARSAKRADERGGDGSVHLESAKDEHRQILGELHEMKDPELLAKGGDVEHLEHPEHDEISDEDEDHISAALGEELVNAIEHKDHKRLMECLEACIMNCMAKGEM